MPDESDKQPEKLEPTTKAPDRIEREQTIITTDQNADLRAALASNPNEFHSMAELPALGPKQPVEAFQIVDEGKTIAASRKVQQQPVLDSFTTGLKAIPETATPQQVAQYQIDYINKKAAESEGGVLPALQGYIEKTNYEYWERAAGSLIGTVQGIGNVAVNLATVADFAAYCIIGDHKRSGEMAVKAGESIANTIFAGGQLFEGAYKYLYDVGFEGDYSKPFSDIVGLAIVLNDRWQQLPPREQERRKSEFISQMLAEGVVGAAGAGAIGKAKTYTGMLAEVAKEAAKKTGRVSKSLIRSFGEDLAGMFSPVVELPGVGKIKMRDLNAVTKEDLILEMESHRPSKGFRGDNRSNSKLSDIGRPKSHIDEHGDLVPADLNGVFNGKNVDVVDHVCGYYYDQAKSHSPFTSLTFKDGFEVKFGNEKITVDLDALREAIKKGELKGTELIEHDELLDMIKKSSQPEYKKRRAFKYATKDHEVLVKGVLPARFLEIGK